MLNLYFRHYTQYISTFVDNTVLLSSSADATTAASNVQSHFLEMHDRLVKWHYQSNFTPKLLSLSYLANMEQPHTNQTNISVGRGFYGAYWDQTQNIQ